YHYYEFPSVHMVPRHNGIRDDRFKLIQFYQFGQWEFYDLKTDPDELVNQFNNPEYADEIARLKVRLEELRGHYQDDSDISEKPDSWKEKMFNRLETANKG
ncbi:MAG: sulfatase/phosphatase domain-containing protein, partial [Planctomycetota bacterium]